MKRRHIGYSAGVAAFVACAVPAQAAPVIVTFGGTYDSGQLAGTGFTGTFSYEDTTPATTTSSFFGDGTIQQRVWSNFLTSAFNITNNQGTTSIAPADARLLINYSPYAGSQLGTTSFDLSGFGNSYQQFYLGVINTPDFAAAGLPKASDFVLSPTLGGYGFNDGGSGTLTSLAATGVVTAVPEPATWALMIGGFGMVGGTMRARTRKVSYATA